MSLGNFIDALFSQRAKEALYKNIWNYVETKYCHEWASFSEKVVLIMESNYSYPKCKVIFD